MRFVREDRTGCDEDSAPSSLNSVDSYDIFESAYSDDIDTDCEYCNYRRRRGDNNVSHSPSDSTLYSCCSIMSRLESAPLLQSAAPTYKSTGSSSTLGPADMSDSSILAAYNRRLEDSRPIPDERIKQSSLVTIFSIWNTIMGSSLLTMAWGVERAGLPAALVLVACMAGLCLYTAYVLLGVHARHGSGRCEVPALCRSLLGGTAAALAHAFSLLVLLGAIVVYWILIANFLYFTVNYLVDLRGSNATAYDSALLCPRHANVSLSTPVPIDDPPYWALHSSVPVYVALIVFPLMNFKDVAFFTKFNSLGTLSVFYLVIFILVKGYSWGINVTSLGEPRGFQNAAVLSGMLALSFYIHNIIITIMGNNEKQEHNGRDLSIAFLLVAITYTLAGAVFYVCFPLPKSCIEDNILNNFEIHDVMSAIARILLLFQVVTVYPLVAFMLRSEAILLLPFKESRPLTVAVNLSIVTLCILVACFCPSIGTIIRYTGAVCGLVHVFALPSLLQMRSLQLQHELTWWKALFYCLILLFGVVNFLLQFFIHE